MPRGYAPIPTDERPEAQTNQELDAAFDGPEDDIHVPHTRSSPQPSTSSTTGGYDFEREYAHYDVPPPGSPPSPSRFAHEGNTIGNTNGLIPDFSASQTGPRRTWLGRAAETLLPSYYAQRLGYGRIPSSSVVGSGSSNDGVFANISAKPAPPVTAVDEDNNIFIVPETSQALPPPSYAAAQLDSVPPYYEATVHAPYSTLNNVAGEIMIDNLPTGTLFSFLWNMLISVSFQFIGFILTFVLHTTHAAKLGSRAGFGMTLIQYGLNLRNPIIVKEPNTNAANDTWASVWDVPSPSPPEPPSATTTISNSASTEWFSFALMTIGWFVLLTSLLGFWRVKRWERGILAANASSPPSTAPPPIPQGPFTLGRLLARAGIDGRDIARGFGLEARNEPVSPAPVPLGQNHDLEAYATEPSISHQDRFAIETVRHARLARIQANESRLREDLEAAGLL